VFDSKISPSVPKATTAESSEASIACSRTVVVVRSVSDSSRRVCSWRSLCRWTSQCSVMIAQADTIAAATSGSTSGEGQSVNPCVRESIHDAVALSTKVPTTAHAAPRHR